MNNVFLLIIWMSFTRLLRKVSNVLKEPRMSSTSQRYDCMPQESHRRGTRNRSHTSCYKITTRLVESALVSAPGKQRRKLGNPNCRTSNSRLLMSSSPATAAGDAFRAPPPHILMPLQQATDAPTAISSNEFHPRLNRTWHIDRVAAHPRQITTNSKIPSKSVEVEWRLFTVPLVAIAVIHVQPKGVIDPQPCTNTALRLHASSSVP